MRHRIKNVANRPIPIDDGTGSIINPESGEVFEAEMSPELKKKVKDGFFDDLGEFNDQAESSEGEAKIEEEPFVEDSYKPKKKKGKKKKKKKDYEIKRMEDDG
ncbi:MAG: hypothetical protein ACTSYA_12160 [Candidatus Kariarchaeaceae archaeon]